MTMRIPLRMAVVGTLFVFLLAGNIELIYRYGISWRTAVFCLPLAIAAVGMLLRLR